MTLLAEYRDARRDEDVARLRRTIALRAMTATGMSQRQIADALGISQSAVSQQLRFAPDLDGVHPEELLDCGTGSQDAGLGARLPRAGRVRFGGPSPGST